jgi:large subunit ribosomal protein L7Ae
MLTLHVSYLRRCCSFESTHTQSATATALLLLPLQARLGALVHKKNAAVVALTGVRKEDNAKLETLKTSCKAAFNTGFVRKWGGGIMGLKTQKKLEKRARAIAAEDAKKAQF